MYDHLVRDFFGAFVPLLFLNMKHHFFWTVFKKNHEENSIIEEISLQLQSSSVERFVLWAMQWIMFINSIIKFVLSFSIFSLSCTHAPFNLPFIFAAPSLVIPTHSPNLKSLLLRTFIIKSHISGKTEFVSGLFYV